LLLWFLSPEFVDVLRAFFVFFVDYFLFCRLIKIMENYKVTDKKENEIFTHETLHPGEVLELELSVRGIKKSEFAQSLGIKPGHLSELLHGKRHVSAHTAINLEKLLGIAAEYWLRVQMHYDLQVERNKFQEAA